MAFSHVKLQLPCRRCCSAIYLEIKQKREGFCKTLAHVRLVADGLCQMGAPGGINELKR